MTMASSSMSYSMSKKFDNLSVADKLPPKYEGYIELRERMYHPSDTIIGNVHLQLRKKLCCDQINVKLYGSVRVFFTETLPGNKPGQLSRNQAYEQEIILVNEEKRLWTAPKSENGVERKEVTIDDIARMARSTSIKPQLPKRDLTLIPGLDIGGYDYEFMFDLPKDGLYTSFEAKNAAGCVRYYIIIEAKSNDLVVFKKKLLFPVVIPVNLTNNIKALESPILKETISYAKGKLTTILELNKRGYVPGERVEGTITIHNNTKESIKTSYLRICQITEAYSKNPEVKYKETLFETAGMGLPINKILSGQTYTYPINYYIPALMPNFEIDACLKMSYYIKLTIGRNRNCLCKGILDITTPLIIGTYPTDENNFNGLNKDDIKNDINNLPPPPSYAECIGGLSDINDNDEIINDDFTPLLMYNYNIRHRLPKYEE